MKSVTLLVGVPASGKTWVSKQLHDSYTVIRHDDYIGRDYRGILISEFRRGTEKPILAETPFSISEIKDFLEAHHIPVRCVFILEDNAVLSDRYKKREGRAYPQGHLTRQKTYASRVKEYGAFSGTAEEVLSHLRETI